MRLEQHPGGTFEEIDVKATQDERDVLSVNEAAYFMNVSPNSLRKALSQGDIASFRLGGRVLVPRRSLIDFIERSLAGSQAQ